MKPSGIFYRFNLCNLVYTLAVIVWGAFVRASESGAGCGAHWPLCNGEILPTSPSLEMLIEFTHRWTSGISLMLVAVGVFLAHKLGEKGSPIKRAANFTGLAIVLEALIGAGLVLLKLVEFDQSMARAISISMHLVNTVFLVASLVSLTYLSKDDSAYQPGRRNFFPKDAFYRGTLAVFIILGISGAVAALGDTLFKSTSLASGFAQDLASDAHFLVKLRIFHPAFACLWLFLGFIWSQKLLTRPDLIRVRGFFLTALVSQFTLGIINWLLLAPTYLQLVHLCIAQVVFISFWLSGLLWSEKELA